MEPIKKRLPTPEEMRRHRVALHANHVHLSVGGSETLTEHQKAMIRKLRQAELDKKKAKEQSGAEAGR